MKYRYYIVSTYDGSISGTNDFEVVKQSLGIEEDFIIDTEKNLWLMSDPMQWEIPEKFKEE